MAGGDDEDVSSLKNPDIAASPFSASSTAGVSGDERRFTEFAFDGGWVLTFAASATAANSAGVANAIFGSM